MHFEVHSRTSSEVATDNDDSISRVNELLDLGAVALPGGEPVQPAPTQPVDPEASLFREGVKDADEVIGECRRGSGRRSLVLDVVPPNYEQFRDVDVRAGLKPSNNLHVLLRHRAEYPENCASHAE